LTEYILLSIIDIVNFKFNEIWYIDGVKYIPTKIEYNPLGTAAKVVLRADADLPLPESQVPPVLEYNVTIGFNYGTAAGLQAYLLYKGNVGAVVTNYRNNGDGTESFLVNGISGLANETFYDTPITSFEDLTGWILSLGDLCFTHTECTYVILPNIQTMGTACLHLSDTITTYDYPTLTSIGPGTFRGNTIVTSISLPLLETADGGNFTQLTLVTTIDLPSLTSCGDLSFSQCPLLDTVYIPLCTQLGSTTGDNNVFWLTASGNAITLTVPTILSTCDSGSPDGDIQTLLTTNIGSTINYV
jgi:hypothetical protein